MTSKSGWEDIPSEGNYHTVYPSTFGFPNIWIFFHLRGLRQQVHEYMTARHLQHLHLYVQ